MEENSSWANRKTQKTHSSGITNSLSLSLSLSQVRCGKNESNREKLKVFHTASSKAFKKVQYDERDRATGEELGLVELYKKTHFSEKKEAWVHADTEIRRYKLEKRPEKAIEDGSYPLFDKQLSMQVFGQKVGYIRGLGCG